MILRANFPCTTYNHSFTICLPGRFQFYYHLYLTLFTISLAHIPFDNLFSKQTKV